MLRYLTSLLAILAVSAIAQSTCPPVNFLAARTVNLKPSATTHIDVARQSDGSYTGFEVADTAPYRVIATTPHFERQFAACLPHTIPVSAERVAPAANLVGVGSQLQVSARVGANYFVAHVSADGYTIDFDVFDAQHNLISETPFRPEDLPPLGIESLALADLNGDGNLDLIAVVFIPTGQGSGSEAGIWTFLGNGDGTFQDSGNGTLRPGYPFLLPLTPAARALAIADLNGDGKADLVLAAPDSSPLTIVLGNGDGTFNPQTMSLAVPLLHENQVSVAIADLNGDGKPDLVVAPCDAGGVQGVAVALGSGNGVFQTPVVYAAAALGNSTNSAFADIATGDVNGDGIPDIVTAQGTILFGDGKGGFPTRADYASNGAGSVMLGDFDGDGKTDILFGTGNLGFLSGSAAFPSLTVMFGSGNGAFAGAPVSGEPLTEPGFTYSGPIPPPAGAALLSADFNGDGLPDLAWVSFFATSTEVAIQITTLKGHANGQFSAGTPQTFPRGTNLLLESAVTADFNGDGKPDVAVLISVYPSEGDVLIFAGNGDGTFGAPVTAVTVPYQNVQFLAAPDVNGDGIPDLVINTDAGIYVSLGKGNGTFSTPATVAVGAYLPSVTFGDFNGDGKLDIAFASAEAISVNVLLGKGDGTYSSAISSALPANAVGSPGNIAAADFDGDGRLDLAVSLGPSKVNPAIHAAPEVVVLLGKGDGTFPVTHVDPVGLTALSVADFNGDKIPDLIGGSATLSICLGNGDGTFQAPAAIPGNAIYAVDDLNKDGSPDVAALFQFSGITTLLNLTQPPPALTVVSAASLASGPLAPGSIASAFGAGLPLSGTTVTVQDSAGVSRVATLYFSSSNQINFIVPAGTATGPASVTVSGGATAKPLTAQVQIAPIAPTIFTTGSGNAAAYATQVAPGGAQTIDGPPIDLSQPGQVYLILFGTGFDAPVTGSLTAMVQGISVPVTYFGPQGTYAGLDQINLALPQSLAGTGIASVSVSAGGSVSNTVFVSIK